MENNEGTDLREWPVATFERATTNTGSATMASVVADDAVGGIPAVAAVETRQAMAVSEVAAVGPQQDTAGYLHMLHTYLNTCTQAEPLAATFYLASCSATLSPLRSCSRQPRKGSHYNRWRYTTYLSTNKTYYRLVA